VRLRYVKTLGQVVVVVILDYLMPFLYQVREIWRKGKEYIMESPECSVRPRKRSHTSRSSARDPINLSMRSFWRKWASIYSQIILIHATQPFHPLL